MVVKPRKRVQQIRISRSHARFGTCQPRLHPPPITVAPLAKSAFNTAKRVKPSGYEVASNGLGHLLEFAVNSYIAEYFVVVRSQTRRRNGWSRLSLQPQAKGEERLQIQVTLNTNHTRLFLIALYIKLGRGALEAFLSTPKAYPFDEASKHAGMGHSRHGFAFVP
jgi:hypothetical protein